MRFLPSARTGAALLLAFAVLLVGGCTARPRSAAGAATGRGAAAQGTEVKLTLATAPFPHPDRVDGYEYENDFYAAESHYQDSSVAVFVPRGYRKQAPVNLVFFFHGWDSSIEDVKQRFDLYRQFSQSGVQALFVIPELARNAPDSFGGKLEDRDGFARFVTELLNQLASRGIIDSTRLGSIVLSGHSGAFEVMALILAQGGLTASIREVLVFDGLYAYTNTFRRWIESGAGRFAAVVSNVGEEATEVDTLIALLKGDGVSMLVVPDDPSTDARTLRARVLFMMSTADHYGVVAGQDELRRLLGASPSLPHRAPA